jgi:fido (protein-threonine AMPylation protein)
VPVPWNDDPPGSAPTIAQNIARILAELAATAAARQAPTVAMATDWHRRIYEGVALPIDYYAGHVRDSDPAYPELIGYEVTVGARPGVPSPDVPQALEHFETTAQATVATADALIAPGERPQHFDALHAVLNLCAGLHGEWIRIHPFANGNGRTARLWANWAALRYGLPPFVRLRPRPEGIGYALASYASMGRDHSVMVGVLLQMLDQRLRHGP